MAVGRSSSRSSLAGCTSSPAAERPPAPAGVDPRTCRRRRRWPPRRPSRPFVAGRVVHTVDGERLRIRLGLRGRWSADLGRGRRRRLPRHRRPVLRGHARHAPARRATGRLVASWASTGPALPGPRGGAAWVSLVASRSRCETGPTLVHVGDRAQDIRPLFQPALRRTTASSSPSRRCRKEGRRYERRTFTTDLRRSSPPRQRMISPRWADGTAAAERVADLAAGRLVPQELVARRRTARDVPRRVPVAQPQESALVEVVEVGATRRPARTPSGSGSRRRRRAGRRRRRCPAP